MENITDKENITDDYVSFETAVLLKEKGFHELCHYETHAYYSDNNLCFHRKLKDFNGEEYSGLTTQWFSRPTLSLARKWLRKLKGIHIRVEYHHEALPPHYNAMIFNFSRDIVNHYVGKTMSYSTYEEALDAAIKKALETL